MGLLKHIRSRSKLKSQHQLDDYPRPTGPNKLARLPKPILASIFNYVCPHTMDDSYEVSEKSIIGESCGLCDLRDLANCALVNRGWYLVVQDVLYHSVRIDAVHFCPLEEVLTERRRKKHVDPSDIVPTRLRLFQRTAWARPDIASSVLFFKLPYMARETYKADLARTISALPNLRHVDLPDGFYSADPTTQILRDQLQATCWDIRKMMYNAGAEQAFEALARQRLWSSMETLELHALNCDLSVLRIVWASMPALNDLKLSSIPRLDDTAFQSTANIPDFPPLQRLRLENAPDITAQGLVSYLARPEVAEVLSYLSLSSTAVTVPALHSVLSQASHLLHFSITETVKKPFPLEPTPALACASLRTLNFEITSPDPPSRSRTGTTTMADSHYGYLSSSLFANGLPSLHKLYVRNSNFADNLLLAPPTTSFAGKAPSSNLFRQPLEIYAKGVDELDWVFTSVAPSEAETASIGSPKLSSTRPVSAYVASRGMGPQWGGEARKSVMMGNGQGGFLAVPPSPGAEDFPRPSSASGLSPGGRAYGDARGDSSRNGQGYFR